MPDHLEAVQGLGDADTKEAGMSVRSLEVSVLYTVIFIPNLVSSVPSKLSVIERCPVRRGSGITLTYKSHFTALVFYILFTALFKGGPSSLVDNV